MAKQSSTARTTARKFREYDDKLIQNAAVIRHAALIIGIYEGVYGGVPDEVFQYIEREFGANDELDEPLALKNAVRDFVRDQPRVAEAHRETARISDTSSPLAAD